MHKLILATVAAVIVTAPLTAVVKAKETTVIKKDNDSDKTVVKKREELNVLPVPHTEEKKNDNQERPRGRVTKLVCLLRRLAIWQAFFFMIVCMRLVRYAQDQRRSRRLGTAILRRSPSARQSNRILPFICRITFSVLRLGRYCIE